MYAYAYVYEWCNTELRSDGADVYGVQRYQVMYLHKFAHIYIYLYTYMHVCVYI